MSVSVHSLLGTRTDPATRSFHQSIERERSVASSRRLDRVRLCRHSILTDSLIMGTKGKIGQPMTQEDIALWTITRGERRLRSMGFSLAGRSISCYDPPPYRWRRPG